MLSMDWFGRTFHGHVNKNGSPDAVRGLTLTFRFRQGIQDSVCLWGSALAGQSACGRVSVDAARDAAAVCGGDIRITCAKHAEMGNVGDDDAVSVDGRRDGMIYDMKRAPGQTHEAVQ